MRLRRYVIVMTTTVLGLMLAMTVNTAAATGHQLNASQQSRVYHHRAVSPSRGHKANWNTRDRAAYVVSTLNAPLCSDGDQLSTVLWNNYDAREFDVLAASSVHNLYFIQVKSSTKALIGVYAYQIGAKLPVGVESAHCVSAASSTESQAYHNKAWKQIAKFNSTYPQS